MSLEEPLNTDANSNNIPGFAIESPPTSTETAQYPEARKDNLPGRKRTDSMELNKMTDISTSKKSILLSNITTSQNKFKVYKYRWVVIGMYAFIVLWNGSVYSFSAPIAQTLEDV